MIVRARFVVPVDSPPVENAFVEFQHGRIIECGLSKNHRCFDVDFEDAVILPGLVNAHTHLELGCLGGAIAPGPNFADWLFQLVTMRNQVIPPPGTDSETQTRARETLQSAVASGVRQSLTSGVTTVGDISAFPQWSRPVIARSSLRAVSFGEVIALGRGRNLLADRLNLAVDSQFASSRLRMGISPHSPYTVEPEGLRICAQRARNEGIGLCIHVAESPDEEAFLRDGAGPLADFLGKVGVWDEKLPRWSGSPVALLGECKALGRKTLLAHANYVSDSDLDLIAHHEASVIYCPRTHAAFAHLPHRFREMLCRGINVCLGTDSLASNPSLSILDELRFLGTTYVDLDPGELVSMATIRGAQALGVSQNAGTLATGKAADFVVLPLQPGARAWHEFLQMEDQPRAVFVDGQSVPILAGDYTASCSPSSAKSR